MDEPHSFNCCLDWRIFKGILYHIFANAVKFCDNGGRIKFRITKEEQDPLLTQNLLDIPENAKFTRLKVAISNTGQGISKSQLRKIQRQDLGDDRL